MEIIPPLRMRTADPCRPAVLILQAKSQEFFKLKARSQRLLHCRDALAQAGLVARSGVLVQRAFLDRFVEGGDGLAVGLFGGRLVAFFDGFAQDTQLGAQSGRVGAVARGAAFGLTSAFERRKMVCHSWFVTFVCPGDIRVGPNYLL